MATRRTPSQYNFRFQLFDEQLLPTSGSKRRSSVRTRRVRHIDIHHMTILSTNDGGANRKCIDVWRTREASAHYGIDKKFVTQFVYDNRMAWGNGNGTANQEGIIVEHSNKTAGPKWEIDEETLQTSAKVVAGLHITHELGRPRSSGFGMGGTIRTHQSFHPTACPGPYFQKIWGRYVDMVQAEYDKMTKKPDPVPTPKPKPTPIPTPTPTPKPKPVETRINVLHWNVAGSDTAHGYQKANGYRGPHVARHAWKLNFDVFLACEAGQANLFRGMNKILGKKRPWQKSAKAIWYRPARVKLLRGRKSYSAGTAWYLKTQKYGGAIFGEFEGKKFSVIEIHTDYRKPAKQAKQVEAIFKKWRKDCDELKIPRKNRVITGDFNWDGSKGDDPFKALTKYGYVEHGNKSAPTFLNGQHLDGVLGWASSDIRVTVESRNNGKMNLSDHNPVRFSVPLV